MMTPVHLLRALHWRPFEAGIACLVQIDASNEPWKTPGILPRLAVEYLCLLNKIKRNEVEGDVFWTPLSSKPDKSVMSTSCEMSPFTPMSRGNYKEVRKELLVAGNCDRQSLSPMQLMLLMEETSSRAMKIAHPIPVDNLAVGKALKRFLAEPVLVGILMLQYLAVIVVVLVISLSETH